MPRKGATTGSRTAQWAPPPPSRAPVDMIDHRKTHLSIRGLGVQFMCPYCGRSHLIRLAQAGHPIQSPCKRGTLTVVAKIAEYEDGARDAH